MLTLDIVIVFIFLIFAIRGSMRGLARELCGLFSLLFSLFLAHTFYIQVAKKITELFQISPSMGIFVAFILIFIGVYILFFIASYFIQLFLKSIHLGFVDKISGAVLGPIKVLIFSYYFFAYLSISFDQFSFLLIKQKVSYLCLDKCPCRQKTNIKFYSPV